MPPNPGEKKLVPSALRQGDHSTLERNLDLRFMRIPGTLEIAEKAPLQNIKEGEKKEVFSDIRDSQNTQKRSGTKQPIKKKELVHNSLG